MREHALAVPGPSENKQNFGITFDPPMAQALNEILVRKFENNVVLFLTPQQHINAPEALNRDARCTNNASSVTHTKSKEAPAVSRSRPVLNTFHCQIYEKCDVLKDIILFENHFKTCSTSSQTIPHRGVACRKPYPTHPAFV